MFKIGIDVGGTFTDFVVAKNGEGPRHFKTPSTPHDPSEGVLTGLQDVAAAQDLPLETLLEETDLIIHGTTVATNTLIERKGAKVGLLTTQGFRDLLEMREGMKEDRYNLRMKQVEPLVPRYLRMDVPERVRSNGEVSTELDMEALDQALDRLEADQVEALAVCFLFSYLNPDHEQAVADRIKQRFPNLYTSLSHEILPQIKEFDRLSTTVVNSYVGPRFGEYLMRLQKRLVQLRKAQDILVMQSNGGVAAIEDSQKQAVRSILSGPAGGVSGATYYAQLIGESKIIGFDMGGTSTDISLIEDGAPHVTGEKFEGGWKIAVPMIDIHTLGAGGGSVARMDSGGILRVGPESAGADPGPACYDRGGDQPTVTDANLVLGYLDADNFLGGKAKLHKGLAEDAIDRHLSSPLSLSTVEAAHGVHKVVSTNMAEGIRLQSVRRGTDPRDFALLAFGGAAGIHVSRVARELKINKVYLPSAAPVLSAYGMLSTDLRYDFSRSHPVSLDRIDLGQAKSILKELEAEGREKLRAQNVPEDRIDVRYSADMRYLDQVYEVTIPLPDLSEPDATLLSNWAENFHNRYQELYSYHQSEQEIRLITLRVSVLGRLEKTPPAEPNAAMESGKACKGYRQMYLGKWQDVPVYGWGALSPDSDIQGPAVLESDFTTVLIEEGDAVRGDRFGGMELRVAEEAATEQRKEESDPITLAVVQNRLESVALEMMEIMLRTSMSQILNSSRDFSTCILDAKCQLVAQGEGIPVHVSALSLAGQAVVDYFGDEICEGDLYTLNDPYYGGSHLPDITVINPVFHEGRLMFFTVNRAHHSDVGGATWGGYNPGASEIYHEGLRLPPLKLHDKGVPRRDLFRMLAANVRHSENFLGDLNAQIGSVNMAARRISAILERHGADSLTRTIDSILSATEIQVRAMISSWPDGVYKGESFLDDDGFDSKMVPIRATVTIEGDSMTIDLSESSPQVTGFINSGFPNTRSLAHVAIMYMASFDVAKNDGSMRPITIIAPKGLIVNPHPPAPVTMSTNHCGEEIIEAVFKALAPAVPDAISSGFSRRLRFAITGVDPRSDRGFIWHFFHGRGGGGASQGNDGWSNVGEINVAGGLRSPSVEVTEERFPFFIKYYQLRPDSAGDGRWRGGLGTAFEMIYEGTDGARLNTAGDGIVNPPYGLFEGEPGKAHEYRIESEGVERMLWSKELGVPVRPGDRIFTLSAGGGGFGDPEGRPQSERDWDRKNGYVT